MISRGEPLKVAAKRRCSTYHDVINVYVVTSIQAIVKETDGNVFGSKFEND